MMRVLLADDEPLALRRLERLVVEGGDVTIVDAVADGGAALAATRCLRPDLVILDVEMPVMSGIAVAKALAGPDVPQIVVLTAFDRYATDAFTIEAIDYLLKPVRPDRLRVAIGRAQRRLSEQAALRTQGDRRVKAGGPGSGLLVPTPLGERELALDEVIWVEAARDYVLIHTAARSHMVRSTMAEVAGRLPDSVPRVHRSAFVNVGYVAKVDRPAKGGVQIELVDGTMLAVGPSYATHVIRLLRERFG